MVKWALLSKLLKSNANYAALMITGLIDSTERINIPGTVGGRNWRYRLPWKLEDIPNDLKVECVMLKNMIKSTKRG